MKINQFVICRHILWKGAGAALPEVSVAVSPHAAILQIFSPAMPEIIGIILYSARFFQRKLCQRAVDEELLRPFGIARFSRQAQQITRQLKYGPGAAGNFTAAQHVVAGAKAGKIGKGAVAAQVARLLG